MTPRDSGQDFDPKHRIIGAVVVVTLAVIFIPLVLGERAPPTAQEPSAGAGSVAAAPPSPRATTKVAITKVTPGEPASAPPAPASEAPVPARTVEPTPPPAPKKTTTAATVSPDAERPSSGWVVQVGTFSSAANATRLERKLRAGGQTVLTERIDFDGGKAVRLRVGPFRERAEALKAQVRIQKDVGVQGVVLAYP